MWNGGDENKKFLLEENDELIGKYVGKKENIGVYENNVYEIETDDGLYGIWGSAVLDDRFSEVEEGEMVKVVFLGNAVKKSGSGTYRNYAVYHQKEKVIKE